MLVVYQDLGTRHDWPVKKSIVNLPISLPRAYGSSSRAIFLMHLLHRLHSKFGYLRIKELSNTHPDCGCYRKEYTLVKK